MKKNLLQTIVAIAFSTSALQAQWINSLTVVPATPGTQDTIYVYADCSFPSGNCDDYSAMLFQQGDTIFAYALHCLGMLTFICSHTDTFKIDPLPAGSYVFIFHLDAGGAPSPCVPGINPGPTDSITFVVNPITSVSVITGSDNFKVYPNPSNGMMNVTVSNDLAIAKNKSLIIYSAEGNEIINRKLTTKTHTLNLDASALPNGIYFCNIIAGDIISQKVRIAIIR